MVIALYPRRVRERYGAEITDLLARSPTPRRDLADVAWCALAERAASLTMSNARPHLPRLIGLLTAPLWCVLTLQLLAGLFATPIVVINALGYDAMPLIGVAMAAPVVPIGAGAMWLAHRTGRQRSIAAPALVVPAALALGNVAAASLLSIDRSRGETWWAIPISTLCWWAATTALATGGTALIRRARTGTAAIVMVAGGLAILELTFTVYTLLVHRSYGLPPSSAFSAYPVVISGIGLGLIHPLARALHYLPALLTVCTAFTLTLATTRAKPGQTAPKPAPNRTRHIMNP